MLKTGANWAGPIKSFKLSVDDGARDRLVSFCPRQLRQAAPNSPDWVATDFKPDADLKILFVGRF